MSQESVVHPPEQPHSFRSFPSRSEDLAESWFDKTIAQIAIKRLSDFSPTADGACMVSLHDGRLAFLKPSPAKASNGTVAREKIASDLAFALGLPVAPVIVRPAGGEFPHHTALSLSVLASSKTWGDGGAAFQAKLVQPLEALRVFWTWIGDVDHNSHPGNLVWEISSTGASVVAIDHSYSMNHRGLPDPLTIPVSTGYGTQADARGIGARNEILRRIENLDWTEIERLVNRLSDILTPQEQSIILNLLRGRRAELRRLLGVNG